MLLVHISRRHRHHSTISSEALCVRGTPVSTGSGSYCRGSRDVPGIRSRQTWSTTCRWKNRSPSKSYFLFLNVGQVTRDRSRMNQFRACGISAQANVRFHWNTGKSKCYFSCSAFMIFKLIRTDTRKCHHIRFCLDVSSRKALCALIMNAFNASHGSYPSCSASGARNITSNSTPMCDEFLLHSV